MDENSQTASPTLLGSRSVNSAVKEYLIGQFRLPHGFMGVVAGRVMARRDSNRRRNLWTLELMSLRPADRVLEIGYGPGIALEQVCRRLTDGLAVGLDHSRTMYAMARKRNRRAAESGRLQLLVGPVEELDHNRIPALAGPFDHIYAVNVVMFWNDPVKILRNLGERLHEDGRVTLTFQPRVGDQTDEAAMAGARSIAEQMRAAGFAGIRIETLRELSPMAVCVIGCNAGIQK